MISVSCLKVVRSYSRMGLGGKCLSRSRRKSRAMLFFMFFLQGRLNQITLRCLFCLVDVLR